MKRHAAVPMTVFAFHVLAPLFCSLLLAASCAPRELKGIQGCRQNCEYLYRTCAENCRSSQLPSGLEGAPQNNVARWDSVGCLDRCDKVHSRCLKDCDSYKSYELEK